MTTPTAGLDRYERTYLHSRNDSSQSSIATTSTSPFSKKTSFASIRNAFKHGKSSDTPPVPPLDHQAYPSLKNPFNRSTSSLAHSSISNRRPSVNTSPPSFRRPALSPPPVPKVPSGHFGQIPRSETPPAVADYEERIVMDPRTPSDYALHAVFIRFATAAEIKIDTFLRQSLVRPFIVIWWEL